MIAEVRRGGFHLLAEPVADDVYRRTVRGERRGGRVRIEDNRRGTNLGGEVIDEPLQGLDCFGAGEIRFLAVSAE